MPSALGLVANVKVLTPTKYKFKYKYIVAGITVIMFKDKGGHLLATSGSPAKVGLRRRPEKETSLSANCAWHDSADKDDDGYDDDNGILM